jgi:hypothetical protein
MIASPSSAVFLADLVLVGLVLLLVVASYWLGYQHGRDDSNDRF